MSWAWFLSLISRSNNNQTTQLQAIYDDDFMWDVHSSCYDASEDDDESYNLWAAYLDSPGAVRNNRAFLERIYNSESHIKQ